MSMLALALLLQLQPAQPAHTVYAAHTPPPGRPAAPVLAFPEPGLDDTAAYQGYEARFYRDSKGNTVQIYLDRRAGRVVQVWADAANESIGFTARDVRARPAQLTWAAESAYVADSAAVRSIAYELSTDAPQLTLGWFVLGSMRVERDFQYWRHHLRPFTAPRFRVAEESTLVARVALLPEAERQRHLALLQARDVAELRARLEPTVAVTSSDTAWSARVEQPSLDERNLLALEFRGDARRSTARVVGRTLVVRARPGAAGGGALHLSVRATTDAAPLTPLARDEIFNADFLAFLAAARAAHDSVLRPTGSRAPSGGDSAVVARYRRLERLVRGVELLSSEEKLMAGLPNFATYFGRDMMMTALMMRSIWSHAMSEHVIASVLRKLSPTGEVSHEEALAEQAIRERAGEYAGLIAQYSRRSRAGDRAAADSVLTLARRELESPQAVRENYHMRDDEFQLPVLVGRYLADPGVPADRKRAFLLQPARGDTSRLALLLRELAYVTTLTAPYAGEPTARNLVSFARRDSTHWQSGSWRDSNAGYANGRFAMDINAIWAPQALEGIAQVLAALRTMGFTPAALDSLAPEARETPLAGYVRDSASLGRAVETWRGARRHFVVALAPGEVARRVGGKLSSLPAAERRYWTRVLRATGADRDSLEFLALSLDADGQPIRVVNTDPATRLFLEDLTARVVRGALSADSVLREVRPFLRPYPVGLFVDSLGPVVANDAYAAPAVWRAFERDTYHSPRVVWGREVNLVLLGLARQIAGAFDAAGKLRDPGLAPYVRALADALDRTNAAVEASGFGHAELWSYRIEGGRLLPVRYGFSSEVQLWSTTDLAVEYVLSRLPRP